ncbi:MAG: PQQ-binding-like beta-propeller repeat protein [Pseudomonadota bacterium]
MMRNSAVIAATSASLMLLAGSACDNGNDKDKVDSATDGSPTDAASIDAPPGSGEAEELWTFEEEFGIPTHVALSQNGGRAFMVWDTNEAKLVLLDTATGKEIWALDIMDRIPLDDKGDRVVPGVSQLGISNDGSFLTACIGSTILGFSADKPEPIWEAPLEGFIIMRGSMARASGAIALLIVDATSGDSSVVVYDKTGKKDWEFGPVANEAPGVISVSVSDDGSVAVGTYNNNLFVIEKDKDGKGKSRFNDHVEGAYLQALLSGDGKVVFEGVGAREVRLLRWNETTYEEVWKHQHTCSATMCFTTTMAISNDGAFAATGVGDNTVGHIFVFGDASGDPVYDSGNIGGFVSSIALSHNGRVVSAGSWGNKAHSVSDFFLVDRAKAAKYYDLSTAGSTSMVSLSGDGRFAIASFRSMYATEMSYGGTIRVFSTGQ